jgi:hypothetical protein
MEKKPKLVKMATKDVAKKADSLMKKSFEKKSFANQQIKFGKASIKAGNGNKVSLLDLKGTTTPTAQKRISNAQKMLSSAKQDSLKSVSLRKQIKR